MFKNRETFRNGFIGSIFLSPLKSDAHGIVSDFSEQQAGQALSSQ